MIKKYKFILLLVLIILLIGICGKVNAASKLYTVNWESVVKNSNGNIVDVIPANTVVEYLGNGRNGLCKIRYRVEYVERGTMFYRTGYIAKSVLKNTDSFLTTVKIKANTSKIVENKIKIVNLAYNIEKQDKGYSQELRVKFYRNYRTTATDCSSLCATIYNRVLGFNMYRDKAKTNVWIATDFVNNANNQLYQVDTGKKISRRFNFVKHITKGEGKLSNKNMQIGDSIVIGKRGSKYEHIVMYIGNGKIIEAIAEDRGNPIYKVIIRSMPSYYYKASTGYGAGDWYKISQIRPFSKYMARD